MHKHSMLSHCLWARIGDVQLDIKLFCQEVHLLNLCFHFLFMGSLSRRGTSKGLHQRCDLPALTQAVGPTPQSRTYLKSFPVSPGEDGSQRRAGAERPAAAVSFSFPSGKGSLHAPLPSAPASSPSCPLQGCDSALLFSWVVHFSVILTQ